MKYFDNKTIFPQINTNKLSQSNIYRRSLIIYYIIKNKQNTREQIKRLAKISNWLNNKEKLTIITSFSNFLGQNLLLTLIVPEGSPSRGGEAKVYVFDINQPSLPTPFYSVLVSVSVFLTLSTVFHSINSLSGLISALLVLSTICLFMKVSLSLDIPHCG